MKEEAVKFITLLRQLNFDELKQFYYMVKGANVVARNEDKSA